MLNHIRGAHSWKDNKLFHKCEHGQVDKEQKWLETDSPSFLALKNVVENKNILTDIKYLSKFCHTGNLEVFHSVLDKYFPKRLHFTLEGMIARTQLAVLDYNCGSNNTQATTKDGERRYKHIFSKMTQNWVVKKYPKQKIENTYTSYYLPHWKHPLTLQVINYLELVQSYRILPQLKNQTKKKP